MIKTDTLQITPEVLSLVAEIDEFKGAWRALGTLAPERLLSLRRVATIESIGSSTRMRDARRDQGRGGDAFLLINRGRSLASWRATLQTCVPGGRVAAALPPARILCLAGAGATAQQSM